jgi:hypothetical protein
MSAGKMYEIYVYELTGSLYITILSASNNGEWSVWVLDNPSISTPSQGFLFTYSGTGPINTPPFKVSSAPFKLRYSANWNGKFTIDIADASNHLRNRTINQEVTAGKIYKIYVYELTGSIYFTILAAPADGEWSLWVVDNTSVSTPSQGFLFNYSGTGLINTPPFKVNSAPFKVRYTTNWTGKFVIDFADANNHLRNRTINQEVSTGETYETYVYEAVAPKESKRLVACLSVDS